MFKDLEEMVGILRNADDFLEKASRCPDDSNTAVYYGIRALYEQNKAIMKILAAHVYGSKFWADTVSKVTEKS